MNAHSSLLALGYFLFSLFFFPLAAQEEHPRIYIRDKHKSDFLTSLEKVSWKKDYVAKLRKEVDHYLEYWEKDKDWMVSRLQMNWKTKHSKVFLKGGNFSHSEGEAPVPTVRFSGTRDWATDYLAPDLEEVEPYFDDPRGLHLVHKESGKKEWIHPNKSGHIIEGINRSIMKIVQDAAFLYWLTGEEKYARFAEPVFTTYIEGMYHREAPYDLDQTGQQRLSGLATFEVIHEKITIYLTVTYDFLHDFLRKQQMDQSKTIDVFQRWADQIIVNGVGENNWNFFQAHFLIYLAAALEENEAYANKKGQQYYLDQIFEVTTDRQIALKESVLVYDQETGIWPESPSYSMHVTRSLLEVLTLFDHASEKNEFENYPIAEKATLASFQYLFPSGYTVSKTSFVEPATDAQQQRLTAIIRTESEQAYVLDVFRSEIRDTQRQKHEYFYHNLGQSLEIMEGDEAITLKPTDELSTQAGDHKAYDYFTDKSVVQTNNDVQAVFRLSTAGQVDNLMKLWVKGSEGQSIFSVKAPPSRALSKGTAPQEMIGASLPTLVLKRSQAAWQDPFTLVYNPYLEGDNNAIDHVNFKLDLKGKTAQGLLVNLGSQGLEDHIVVNSSMNDIASRENFYQKGLLSVIRRKQGDEVPVFLFLSGIYRFDYQDWQVISIGEAVSLSMEVGLDGIQLKNNKPVLIRIPRREGEELPLIKLYRDGEIVGERKGVESRLNPGQVEFRLPIAYEKAIIVTR